MADDIGYAWFNISWSVLLQLWYESFDKFLISAGYVWHFEGRIVTLQFGDVNLKYNSLKLVTAYGNVLKTAWARLVFLSDSLNVLLWNVFELFNDAPCWKVSNGLDQSTYFEWTGDPSMMVLKFLH